MQIVPELFAGARWRPAPTRRSAEIVTPLERVVVEASVDAHPLDLAAAASFDGPDGATLWVWDGGVFRVELLRAHPHVDLPPGMRVDGCEAAMWRFRATERPAECEIVCRWRSLPGGRPGDPERGERLESQAWHGAGRRVSIGTPEHGEAVHYRPDGFRVSVPLEPGARFETHFVVAWSPDVFDDASTWFAVDCTPARMLAGLGARGG